MVARCSKMAVEYYDVLQSIHLLLRRSSLDTFPHGVPRCHSLYDTEEEINVD